MLRNFRNLSSGNLKNEKIKTNSNRVLKKRMLQSTTDIYLDLSYEVHFDFKAKPQNAP